MKAELNIQDQDGLGQVKHDLKNKNGNGKMQSWDQ